MSESLEIEWTEALATGDEAIDNQHKYLVDLINELARAIERNEVADKMKEILMMLEYYTTWHFESEEGCMMRKSCQAACQNKEAHNEFIQTFLAFKKEYYESEGSRDIALRMYKTLTSWVVNHIQKIDSNLATCQ